MRTLIIGAGLAGLSLAERLCRQGRTPAAEVRRWLTSAPVDHTLRLEPLLRSAFFWLTTPAELADHPDREAAHFHTLARKYRDLAEAKDQGDYGHSPPTRSLRMTVEASARINEVLGDWPEWARRPAAPQEADR